MLYTIAEAAKAMGLEESVILKAIEDGQITGTKSVSGEWQVDDVELNLLYLLLARDYCKRHWQADARTDDERSQEPEIANTADDYEARLETSTGADRAEASPSHLQRHQHGRMTLGWMIETEFLPHIQDLLSK